MKTKLAIVVLLALVIGGGLSLWGGAKATPDNPLSFLKEGGTYKVFSSGLETNRITPLQIRSDGWIKIKDEDGDVWWLNANNLAGIMEVK